MFSIELKPKDFKKKPKDCGHDLTISKNIKMKENSLTICEN